MYWLILVLNTLKNKFCFYPYEDLKFQSTKALNIKKITLIIKLIISFVKIGKVRYFIKDF